MSATSEPLLDIPDVHIDQGGRFKYILIKIGTKNEEKYVVRGYAWAEYHGNHVFMSCSCD